MSSSSFPVQTAIFSRLDALLSVPVYDDVPQDAVPPYVMIGEGQEIPADTKTHHGIEHQVEIQVFSEKEGAKEIKTILGSIYTELHRNSITVSGFSATVVQHDSQVIFRDLLAGWRGVVVYRLYTTDTNEPDSTE
jgi:hypothetical protein